MSAIVGSAFADIHYVSPSGNHVSPFLSWTDAATNIQAAVDAATDGDTVLVGDGTYVLVTEIVVSSAIAVQGARNATAKTVGTTIIDGNKSTRCFKLIHADAVLDNLTITHGKNDHGAGVYCQGGTIRNCVIANNDSTGGSGGGICAQVPVTIERCTIAGNCADFSAGIHSTAAINIESCVISGNVARVDGGGLSAGRSTTITGSTISGNRAGRNAGGINTSYRTDLSLTECTISGNTAGSGAEGCGGGLQIKGTARADLSHCTISGNTAGFRGGGIYNADTLVLAGSTVEDNTANKQGGGIFNLKTRTVTATDTDISRNTADAGPDFHGSLDAAGRTTLGDLEDTVITEPVKEGTKL